MNKEQIITFIKEICSLDANNQCLKIPELRKYILSCFAEIATINDLDILNKNNSNCGLFLDAYAIAIIGKIGSKN